MARLMAFAFGGTGIFADDSIIIIMCLGSLVYITKQAASAYGNKYHPKQVSYKNEPGRTVINVSGTSDDIIINYQIEIESSGKVLAKYNYENIPREYINEIGMKFTFGADEFDAIKWNRRGYWSYYPENYISGNTGTAHFYPTTTKKYRERPEKDWSSDTKMFYYEGTGNETAGQLIQMVKATKENVYQYVLLSDKVRRFEVLGDGKISCRLDKDGNQINLNLIGILDYPDLEWGNYQKNLLPAEKVSGVFHFKIY